jgi:hypothetical protein
MILYHFTSEHHLPTILAEGVLRTTDPNLFGTGPTTYINRDTGEVFEEFDKRAVRITVEVRDARRWLDWLKARKYDAKWVQIIISAGGGKAAARHWYVVPRPVVRAEWVEVRDMRTGEAIEGLYGDG